MYKVYVLYSVNFKKIYVGYTSDLPSRLASHNTLATKGYTLRYRPWTVIHVESFDSKKEALLREDEHGNTGLITYEEIAAKPGRMIDWDEVSRKIKVNWIFQSFTFSLLISPSS